MSEVWKDVCGRSGIPSPMAIGVHSTKYNLSTDLAACFDMRTMGNRQHPWPVAPPKGERHKLTLEAFCHDTSQSAFQKMCNDKLKQLEMAGHSSKTLLPVVWFGAVVEESSMAEAKAILEKQLHRYLCASFLDQTNVLRKLGTEQNAVDMLSSFTYNLAKECHQSVEELSFSSPAFSPDSSRYGVIGISVPFAEMLKAYSASRNVELGNLCFRVFLTHKFKFEVERAVLVCTSDDDGPVDVAVPPKKISDLPILSSNRSQLYCNNPTSHGLLGSNRHHSPRVWEALHFAFYVPKGKALKIPYEHCKLAELSKIDPFLGDRYSTIDPIINKLLHLSA